MAPPGPTRPTASERLPLIEEAATRLFAERGYGATTVDDIAEAAGLTKPMLYRHFDSKQELCVALLERARAELIEAPLAHFTPESADPLGQVPAMVEAWLEHVQQHRDAARLLLIPITGDPEVERVQRDLHTLQAATQVALLHELVPELDTTEAEAIGTSLRACMSAVALWWLDRPDVPRDVPARVILRSFHGLTIPLDPPDTPPSPLGGLK